MSKTIFIIIFVFVFVALVLGITYKISKFNKNKKDYNLEFIFDNERMTYKEKPLYASEFKNLDENVSGAVRLNRSLYFNDDEYKKFKQKVLSKDIPLM